MTGLPRETFQHIGGDSAPKAFTSTLNNPQPWFTQWATGGSEGQPPFVSEFTEYSFSALFTAITLISGTIASLPCKVFRKRKDGGQDEVLDHPAVGLMQKEYNPNTSSITGRETEVGHLLAWGNSYAQIVRSRAGELLSLQPIGPDVVCVEADGNGALEYRVRSYDRTREKREDVTLKRHEVLHTPYSSFDALLGVSPIRVAKSTVRMGLAQDKQAERFVTKGMRSPGVLEMPTGKKFRTDAEATQFRARWMALHNNEESDTSTPILEDGMTWKEAGFNPESAQLLESRRFTRGEVAGLYHIPPHLMGDVEKNTSWGSGIEELNIGFISYCLMPILLRIEQERNRKLFRPDKYKADKGLFVEHILAGLLKGDSSKQATTLQTYLNLGVLTVNEVRRILGHNPAKWGNVSYFPLNTGRVNADTGEVLPQEAAQPAVKKPEPLPTTTDRDAGKLAVAFRKTMSHGLARCLRKEAAEAIQAAKKPNEFTTRIDDFYSRVSDQIRELFDTPLTVGFADRHIERSKSELLTAAECRPDELVQRVTAAVDKWPTDRVVDLMNELSCSL